MRQLLTALVIVVAVHALTFLMVALLPDAAVVALGILGGNRASIESFWEARETATYADQLLRLAQGDLGQTLDHSPVLTELSSSLLQTLPFIGLSAALAFLFAVLALNARARTRRKLAAVADTLALMPPFVFAFLIAPMLFATPYVGSPAAAQVALLVSVLAPLTIMVCGIMLRFYEDATGEHFGTRLRLNGVGAREIEQLGRLSAYVRVLSLSDRVIVAALVSILIAEPLLGLAGLGTLYARAIRTADPNLTVAISTVIAIIVVGSGLLSGLLKAILEKYGPLRGWGA
jgi:ABC-type dipeptide/oligopeptide/nickel transport system permease component